MTPKTKNCWMVLEGKHHMFEGRIREEIPLTDAENFACRCVEQVNKASRGDLTPEELKERQVNHLFQWLVVSLRLSLCFLNLTDINFILRPRQCKTQKSKTFSQIL